MWDEYCRLRKEVKQLVIEKKLNIWNKLVEKVNTDFDENKKEFWAFVGRKTKGKKKNISSLRIKYCTLDFRLHCGLGGGPMWEYI